jgi:tetratricopeptide (TPR) repeat protein
MTQIYDPRHQSEAAHRFPWTMVGAIIFLVISLAVSGVLIVGAFSDSVPAAGLVLATSTPEAAQAESVVVGTLEATAEQPVEHDAGTVIALASLGADAPALSDALTQAIQGIQPGAALPGSVSIQTIALPPELASAADIDVSQVAPGAAMLIVWEKAEDGLVRVYLLGAPDAPILGVGGPPAVWDVPAPGKASLILSETSSMELPAGLAVGLLEVSAGAVDQASGRFETLQALPSTVPIDKMSGNQAVLSFAVARAQTARGDLTAALQTYSQALKLQGDFAAAAINRGNIYVKLGDAGAALSAYDTANVSGADLAVSLYNQTLAHYLANDLDAALESASMAVDLAPGAPWSTNLHGYVSYLRGDYQSAQDDFAAASQSAPEMSTLAFNRAWALIALTDYDQALTVFDELLKLDPDNPSIYLQQGRAYQANGNAEKAEDAFGRAIQLDPGYLDAYLLRARLYFDADDLDRSQTDVDKAIELNPDDGRAYQIAGDILTSQEAFGKAKDAYTAAIDRGISGADVYAARGWARQRTRYNAGAIDDYEQALALGSKDTTLLFRLGFALFDAGRYEDSLDAALGAVNGGLDTAEAHALLALALDTNLQRDEAGQEYQKALDLEPNFSDRDFLKDLPLWSDSAIGRAMSIVRRLGK